MKHKPLRNTIPNAEDFVQRETGHRFEHKQGKFIHENAFRKALQEFAALHVQAALRAASEVLVIDLDNMSKEAILNAYPLTKRK